MNISTTTNDPWLCAADIQVYFVHDSLQTRLPEAALAQIATVRRAGDFPGREEGTLSFYPGSELGCAACRVLIIGLGREKINGESFRVAGGRIAQMVKKIKAAKIVIAMPEELEYPLQEMSQYIVEGVILGNYQFTKYKTVAEDDEPHNVISEVIMAVTDARVGTLGMKRGLISAESVCQARDMANEPGNQWTAEHFAVYAKKLAAEFDMPCKILGKSELGKLKMGGLLGVNQGTTAPPRLITLEYRTGRKVPTLMLVGKGLTFDSGGISLKPSAGMQDMKYDMCGGAVVLAVMAALGRERPDNIDVVAVVPATDNMPGPGALKPGDIIRQYNGKTVEIISTDAEGRLILADALSYGIKHFKPEVVIDLATLTGAVIVGLGHHMTGLMSNDDELVQLVCRAGEQSAEPVWRLPLGKEYTKQLKSQTADLKNVGDKGAGTITAGAFLQEFITDTKWAHLDIAGTAWNFTEKSYVPTKGPSGVGVRLLLEFIREWHS